MPFHFNLIKSQSINFVRSLTNWRKMISHHAGPGRVVILDELGHEVIQMPLAEDDELAEAFQLRGL